MGWIEDLRGKTVGLDTSPFIYYIEKYPGYIGMLRPFFQAVDRGEISIVTSVVALLETLVQPLRRGSPDLVGQYQDILFNTRGLATIPLSQYIAEEAAHLRASHQNLRTPDAIQVATAIRAGASFFLTNDIRLSSLPELPMLVLDKLRTEPAN